MIILHGFAFSNYYNIVKHVLLHKGIPFEEDLNYGGTEEYLAISPVGKVPSLTTEQGGNLSESSVCCDYLEEAYPEPALYPADSFGRGHVRQIMKVSELYLELPCRRLIPAMFSNTQADDSLKAEVRQVVERGVGAINRLSAFDPYVTGSDISMADIYLRYVMSVVDMAAASQLDWDIGAEITGLRQWQAMMAETDIARKVDADQAANQPEFFEYMRQRFGG